MLLSTALFAIMHAITKTLTRDYDAFQLSALRGLASLPFIAAWISRERAWRSILHVRWPLQVLRGACGIATIAGFTFALKALPLADAYALSFSAPLFATWLSVLLLRERVDLKHWLAVLVGFLGVTVVLQPSGTHLLTAAGFAMLLSAVGYAASIMLVRVLVRTDSPINLVLWVTVFLIVGAGSIALPQWHVVDAEHLPRLAAIGALGFAGQYAVTLSLRMTSASVIAPFEYSALLWALVLDWTFWDALPAAHLALGTVLIISSGLYIAYRQRRRDAHSGEQLLAQGPERGSP
jgi:drug/metabolite transporter (DMT)-like permease